jgi:hypothetical protein
VAVDLVRRIGQSLLQLCTCTRYASDGASRSVARLAQIVLVKYEHSTGCELTRLRENPPSFQRMDSARRSAQVEAFCAYQNIVTIFPLFHHAIVAEWEQRGYSPQ